MKIQDLKSIKKRVQRIGRSGKRGSYSGRGVKGQKSRSGRRLRPAERDLILRIPKMRGFANLPRNDKGIVLNLGEITVALKGAKGPIELNHEFLRTAGLIRKGFKGTVKLLGTGEITVAINTGRDIKASESATAKIKKAGGSVLA